MAQERAGHRSELHCVFRWFCILLLSVLLLLLASSAVLLNCPYPDPRVLPFSSHSSPTPAEGGATERPRGLLLPARAKPQHRSFQNSVFLLLHYISLHAISILL